MGAGGGRALPCSSHEGGPRTEPPVTTDIILADIVGFSELSDHDQQTVAQTFTGELQRTADVLAWGGHRETTELILAFVPTGDGFYVLLQPLLLGYGLFFAASLRSALLVANERAGGVSTGVRLAVHCGDVHPFHDITGRLNFVGEAMNRCARLLAASPADSPDADVPDDDSYIIASPDAIASYEMAYPKSDSLDEFLALVRFRMSAEFIVVDKHGKTHRGRFVELSRHIALNPPPPADLARRLTELAARIPQGT